ncbi:hypothetical protein FH972_022166 [Carpinus fangiana]|uniref:Nudix hydrolase domain-containing protein n=1 Tax=Carpinus fangiana TaxID=176857 RepID=A0A5N6KRG0_9ROSI|nr:hypothetical protein FH972_022166 [Carpinus fangiana]
MGRDVLETLKSAKGISPRTLKIISMAESKSTEESLIPHLHTVLGELYHHPYPHVPCPGELKKRASVALIIRVNPRYEQWPDDAEELGDLPTNDDTVGRLARFFAKPWVQHGDPEVLFIKRAARKGDRWEGHIALPGGRRDPEDADDQAAAVRETSEEVGIDLSPSQAIAVGNLPQRLVTTSWGKVPLMILCPYIFLLDKHEVAPQRLQPTEIASTHWVPLRALLNPALRTWEYQDVSSRFARQRFGLKRLALRYMLGHQMFNAIKLVPSESLYCSSIPGFVPDIPNEDGIMGAVTSLLRPRRNRQGGAPLLLWGLTLGVLTDFLDMLPPHNAIEMWTCPTFSPPDIQFMIWVMSYRFTREKHAELRGDLAIHPPSGRTPGPGDGMTEEVVPEAGIEGLGSQIERGGQRRPNASAVSRLLEGYYDIIMRALAVTFIGRASVVTLAIGIWLRHRRRNAL